MKYIGKLVGFVQHTHSSGVCDNYIDHAIIEVLDFEETKPGCFYSYMCSAFRWWFHSVVVEVFFTFLVILMELKNGEWRAIVSYWLGEPKLLARMFSTISVLGSYASFSVRRIVRDNFTLMGSLGWAAGSIIGYTVLRLNVETICCVDSCSINFIICYWLVGTVLQWVSMIHEYIWKWKRTHYNNTSTSD